MQGSRGELMEHCGVGAAAVPVSCSEQGALLFCILCAWSFICLGFFSGGGGGDGGEAKNNRAPHCVQWELAWIWERHPQVAGEKKVLPSSGAGGWRGSQKQSCPTLCAVGACLDMGETSPGRWRKKSSPFCFQTADSNTMQYV